LFYLKIIYGIIKFVTKHDNIVAVIIEITDITEDKEMKK